MLITSGGNVGIGTSSPVNYSGYRSLHISSAASSGSAILYLTNSTESIRGLFFAEGTANRVTLGSQSSHDLTFISNDTERMRINSSGGVLIKNISSGVAGVTVNTPNGFSSGGYVHSSLTTASASWYHLIAQSGNGSTITTNNILIYGNGNVENTNNSYGVISDIKLKENIVDASPKLNDLMKVRIVNYNLKADLGYESNKQIGVIAQELEKIFPGLVDENKDIDIECNDLGTTTKSVKMSVFVPMLIKAMQEQQAQIEELKAKIK
jgi:hypothetical protein